MSDEQMCEKCGGESPDLVCGAREKYGVGYLYYCPECLPPGAGRYEPQHDNEDDEDIDDDAEEMP